MSAVLEPGATRMVGCPGVSMISTKSYPLPYTNDLVRLAASVRIVIVPIVLLWCRVHKNLYKHIWFSTGR